MSESVSRSLPDHPDLDQLKTQAKELLETMRAQGNASAALHEAQLSLAKSYGFASWAKLKEHVDRATIHRLLAAVKRGDIEETRSLLKRRPELVHVDAAENDEHRALHYAVLREDVKMVDLLMDAGADARKGVYPHRDASTAWQMAFDRGFTQITAAIEAGEQHRREELSCPNVTVSPEQDQLSHAIRGRDFTKTTAILDVNPDLIRACDRNGASPLHVAAKALDEKIVRCLLEHRANVTREDTNRLTPLDHAVIAVDPRDETSLHRFQDVAKLLRNAGAPLTARAAIALGETHQLHRLTQEQPAAFAPDWFNGPLCLAVRHRQKPSIKKLLELGWDPDERALLSSIEPAPQTWGSPLWFAAYMGDMEIAKLLLDHGADPNGEVYASGNPVGQTYNARNPQMRALLLQHGGKIDPIAAGHYNDAEPVLQILEHADPALVEEIMWAGTQGASRAIVEKCLSIVDWSNDDPRWTRMINCTLGAWRLGPNVKHNDVSEQAYIDLLKLYLARGVNVNLPGRRGETRLHTCATSGVIWGKDVLTREGRRERARLLLDAGALTDRRDEMFHSTPMAWAARWGRLELVSLYLSRGIPATEPDAEPWATPAAWARRYGHREIEDLLTRSGK